MSKLFFAYVLTMYTGVANAGNSCSIKTSNIVGSLAQNIQDCANKNKCIDLKVGEKSWIYFDEKQSPTTVKHSYILERKTDKEFLVTIPLALEHVNANEMDSTNEAIIIQKKIRLEYDKIDQCLNSANPYLKGPNGESLIIKIERPAVKYKTIQENLNGKSTYKMNSLWNSEQIVKVNLHQDYSRANSENYSESLNCTTITHEILHLTGLSDEYQEKVSGFIRNPKSGTIIPTNDINKINTPNTNKILGNNCRVTAPSNSIMNDQTIAFENAKGSWIKIGHRCFYPHTDKNKCAALYNQWNSSSNHCPENGEAHFFEVPIDEKEASTSPKYKVDKDDGSHECWISNYENKFRREADSLLYPAHFFSITRPGCEKYNRIYYTCAKRAYLTDTGNHSSCNKNMLPAECQNNSDAWLKQVGR